MQVDAPPEDNDNTEEPAYIVENPSIVSIVSLKIIIVLFIVKDVHATTSISA